MIIDPKNENSINNWYIKNQRKYYNNLKKSYFIAIIVAISLIESSIIILTTFAKEYTIYVILAILFFFNDYAVINAYLIFGKIIKMERFGKDSLGLKNELILVVLVCVLFVVLYGTTFTLLWIEYISYQTYLVVECIDVMIFSSTLISTWVIYPKYYGNNLQQEKINKREKIEKNKQKMTNMALLSDYEMTKSSNQMNISWTKLISFYDGFEAIMNHLEREFAMENLLFVQEVQCILLFFVFFVFCLCVLLVDSVI